MLRELSELGRRAEDVRAGESENELCFGLRRQSGSAALPITVVTVCLSQACSQQHGASERTLACDPNSRCVILIKRTHAMERAFVCCRYFLVFGAIVLGISGAVVSIFSGYFVYQLYEYTPLTPDKVCGSSGTLLAMGVVTCGIGWFAFQFLNFSNRGQVIIFSTALTIIMVTEIGVGIWALVRHEQVDVLPAARLEKNFALATTDQKSVWDHMQAKLHCCGIDGPADYRGQDLIPWSCCNTTILANDNITEGACTNIYKRGCQHVVINRTRSILLHVFLLALCSVLLQISFILCICCYTKIYKKKMEKRSQSQVGKHVSEQDTRDNLLARSKHLNNADDS